MLKPLPSQEELKRLFDYHTDGYFFHKVRTRYHNTTGKRAGYINPKGYTILVINNIGYLAHRLIYKWHTGIDPNVIDHICHQHISLHNKDNPYDNRIENLKDGDFSDNNQNRAIKTKHYYYCERTKKYRAVKRIRGKNYDKRFNTEQEAIDYINFIQSIIS